MRSRHAASNMTVSVLLTCFNRREQTLECLRLMARQKPCGATLHYFLVDDGSTDGTAEAVAREFPEVNILHGDGSLYWCGGMRLAWRTAAASDPDYYLLLNDDTYLYAEALAELLALTPSPDQPIIAVAAIRDPATGKGSYGGRRRKTGLVPAAGQPEKCDTFNGNCVLISRAVYARRGVLHDRFTHAMGDLDYGFQATKRGIPVIQSPNYLGTCTDNPVTGTWRDRTLPRTTRWKILGSAKYHPFFEWMEYNRRNSGFKWPLATISPWIRVLLNR